jgi:hypothetical protein
MVDSCGWALSASDIHVVDQHSGKYICCNDGEGCTADAEHRCLVEACIQYGLGAPLETFTGKSHPRRIRAKAVRFAYECMKDRTKVNTLLDRPVNAIGSTAREYGQGDVTSALLRGPVDATKSLMRKMHGIPVNHPESKEHEVEFGTIQEDGQLVNVRWIRYADMGRCKFTIMMPDHYRVDGSCKCDDLEHRQLMIEEWGYKRSDFSDIPLRVIGQ